MELFILYRRIITSKITSVNMKHPPAKSSPKTTSPTRPEEPLVPKRGRGRPPTGRKSVKIDVSVDERLAKKAKSLSNRNYESMSAFVSRAIRQAVEMESIKA